MGVVIVRFDEKNRGKEIFHLQPIVLGGDPINDINKVVLTRAEHIEAVKYWNRVIADLKKQS